MPISIDGEYFFEPFSIDSREKLFGLKYPQLKIDGKLSELSETFSDFAVYAERPYTKISLSATLAFICLHVTKEQAANSGLLGLLADAPVQLVDFDDEERLRAFHALFEKGCSSHKRPEVSKLFASILAPGFQAHVQSWREKVDWLMMANAWLCAKFNWANFIPIHGDPGLVWNPPLLDDQITVYMMNENRNEVSLFDNHHPWVMQAKKELPRVAPKVMFLVCTDECDVGGNIGMVRHLLIPPGARNEWHDPPV